MEATPLKDFSRLAIHTITTKPWGIETAVEKYAAAGIKGITVWRNAVEGKNRTKVGKLIKAHQLDIVSYVRGGFFPSADKHKRETAIADNKKMIEEAAELGAPSLVLVCGAEPEISLEESRKQIETGIRELLELAEKLNVSLAIEPLHPMYADTRSAINTLKQANDMAEAIDSPLVGVAVDVYHLWWDPDLEPEIRRCGAHNHLFAFHICDWKVPTEDFLLDRGLMGEGCIRVKEIRKWVEEAGFKGFNEVEIFSNQYWAMDQDAYLDKIKTAYLNHS